MRKRVVVAMSGGVDSSVAAALLQKQDYEVIGITMCFNLADSMKKKPICCGMQGIEDARRVCHKLGIRHYVLNMQKDLEKYVINDFCQEYLRGRTPNPCVRCNQHLKFNILLKKALSLDADFLATGHYARKAQYAIRPPSPRLRRTVRRSFNEGGRNTQYYLLKKAKDKLKDQSYFLYRLSQSQLKDILFPIGDYTKTEVRKLAKEFALPVADKLASQEICFLPNTDYRRFLKLRMTAPIKPGMVTDKYGNVLGQHRGIAFYTIGQREGLGIAAGYPLYIIQIDAKNNRIVVGRKEDAHSSKFLVKEPHFILKPWKKKIAVKVRIRYNHSEAPAEVMPFRNQTKICFKKPQFAVTPGQSVVFYDGDKVLGGGIIDKVLD